MTNQVREIPMIAGQPMVCEQHPWLLWPDGDADCAGPGMPLSAGEPGHKLQGLIERVLGKGEAVHMFRQPEDFEEIHSRGMYYVCVGDNPPADGVAYESSGLTQALEGAITAQEEA